MIANMPANHGVYVNLGPNRIAKPTGNRAVSDVVVQQPDGTVTMQDAYSESRLQEIIEQGSTRPRVIPPELQDRVEASRVADREDHRILETQFAGIGASGTYGSLDGRTKRRPAKNIQETK